jgi:hypothetical protein
VAVSAPFLQLGCLHAQPQSVVMHQKALRFLVEMSALINVLLLPNVFVTSLFDRTSKINSSKKVRACQFIFPYVSFSVKVLVCVCVWAAVNIHFIKYRIMQL